MATSRRSAGRRAATPIAALDIRRVVGIRVTVTARSSTPVTLGEGKAPMRQPAAEDHAPTGRTSDTYLPLPALGNVAAAQPGCGVLTMADTRNCRTSPDERGIALVMVILLLLVLTVLGITATMLMTQEDRISSRQETQKARSTPPTPGCGGARRSCFWTYRTARTNLTAFLAHVPVANTVGGDPRRSRTPPAPWDIEHLGTYLTTAVGGGTELANQEVTQLVPGGGTFDRVRAYYSLYVRNNPEDTTPGGPLTTPPGGLLSPLVNYDTRLRLISVGFLTDSNGVNPTFGERPRVGREDPRGTAGLGRPDSGRG